MWTVSLNYPKILTQTKLPIHPPPSSGQKWSALKRRNCALFMDLPVQDLAPSTLSQWRLRCWANSRFRLASNTSVGRSDWKKKPKKQNHKKSRNRRPWYPRTTLKVNIHIFGLTKYTIYCKKMFMSLFLFFSMLLLCSFFRLKELFQVKNGLTRSLLFFWKCQKFGSVGRR